MTSAVAELLGHNIFPAMHWQNVENAILVNILREGKQFSSEEKKTISDDLHKAVGYLHRNHIYHGAITENSVLIYKVRSTILLLYTKLFEHFFIIHGVNFHCFHYGKE